MKKIYFKLLFTLLVAVQVAVIQVAAQSVIAPLCPCSAFKAQAVPIIAPDGQCCYAIQIQQVYPAQSDCRPSVIKLSSPVAFNSPPSAGPAWILQSGSGAGYFYTMPAQSIIQSSAAWNTVATICAPKCQPIPEISVEWKQDIGGPSLCKAIVNFPPCPGAVCDLRITNQPIVCGSTAGNYTLTYTLTNNSYTPCTSSVSLNQSYNTLQSGTALPASAVIAAGASVTQTVSVTATPGSVAFYMNVCCVNATGLSKCCSKDSLPWPPCITCNTGCLSAVDPFFCDQGATTLNANYCTTGTPINSSNIKWYRAAFPCPAIPTDPTGNFAPGWTLFQTSGNTATTSSPLLTASTCYIAFVNEDANCRYWTSPVTVAINKTPVITTIQDRNICDPSPATFIKAPPQSFNIPFSSGQSVKWYQSADCINYSLVPLSGVTTTLTSSTFNTGGLNGSSTANPCDTIVYCYRAELSSVNCGTVTKDFRVSVYSLPQAGIVKASPASVCNGKASTISRIPGCGKIVKWEKSAYSTSPVTGFTGWTDITPYYGTANDFSTNNLYNSGNCVLYIAYRVTVENGVCSPANQDTRTVIVQVLPNMKPVISVPGGAVCIGPLGTNLTCKFPVCPAPLYPLPPVIYTWYHNSPASGIVGSSVFNAKIPGTYWVTASNSCGSWTSAPVTLCSKPVVTLPPGCICRRPPANTPYKLAVQISGGCTNCTYTVIWREKKNGPWIFTGTATGLTAGTTLLTIPANKLPSLTYGEQLHFQVQVVSTSCGTSCLPALSNINTVAVCPQ
jgi:hypothetical protein